jgi:IclR family transcriptional regulator, KDG regulon repressor
MSVIQKTISLLDTFLDQNTPLSLDEMSRLTKMNKTTVRRIAVTLVKGGFLRQPEKRGKYALGMRFLDFTKAIKGNNPVMDTAAPHLFKLSQEVNETVALAIWDGESAVICQNIHPNHPLKVISNEGKIMGLHYTSLGKAIIAHLTDAQLKRLFPGELAKSTPNSITDYDDLKNHLLIVKQRGVAIDDEEFAVGVRGVGAALKDGTGSVLGSISVLGPSVRLSRERLKECVNSVKRCAREISIELGYDGD